MFHDFPSDLFLFLFSFPHESFKSIRGKLSISSDLQFQSVKNKTIVEFITFINQSNTSTVFFLWMVHIFMIVKGHE